MSLSKPLYRVLGMYFEQLHTHSMRTKSVSSSVAAILGNVTSQYVSGCKVFDFDGILAFGVYGLLFGNTLPNLFYQVLLKVCPGLSIQDSILQQLLVDRLFYTPLFVAVCIYVISRLQIQTTDQAYQQLQKHFWPVLKVNWLWFTILHFAILKCGPPMIHVPLFNVVEYFWYLYLAFRLKMRTCN